MERNQVVLAALAAGGPGACFYPIQVQKLFFLIDREIPDWVGGPHFRFKSYHYGPFDRAVYEVLDSLAMEGQVGIDRAGQYRRYALAEPGVEGGTRFLAGLPKSAGRYLKDVADWVRFLTFGRLVAAIYEHYPDMRANSIIPDVTSRYPRAPDLVPVPSFLSGMARAFDFMGTLDEYPSGRWDSRHDALAIRRDWAVVGNHLTAAMESDLRGRLHES